MTSSASAAKHKKRVQAEKGRELVMRQEGQLYARVTKMLGNGRVTAMCGDGVERLCKIRGSMRKRVWVRVGDAVLVGLREFQDAKADVIHKYTDAEVARLRRLGEDVVLATSAADDGDETTEVIEFEHDPDDPEAWAAI